MKRGGIVECLKAHLNARLDQHNGKEAYRLTTLALQQKPEGRRGIEEPSQI